MGGAAGGGIGWVGHGHTALGARIAHNKSIQQSLDAVEGIMKESGIPVPPRPMSRVKVFWIGFSAGLMLGLLIGFIVWELT